MKTDNWYPRLVDFIHSHERTPFQPGFHDCALFVASAIEIQSGIDPAVKWRGRYKTIAGGVRLMNKDGFADHFDFVEKVFTSITHSKAQSGDIGAVQTDDGLSLGIVIGAQIYVLTVSGLGILPLSSVVKAWSAEATIEIMEI